MTCHIVSQYVMVCGPYKLQGAASLLNRLGLSALHGELFICIHRVIINPRCTCAGGLRYLSCVCVCVSVCLSVCLCVCTPAPTTLISMLKMSYVGVYLRLFLLFNSWIFDKSFRSKVMARKSQYANEQLLCLH